MNAYVKYSGIMVLAFAAAFLLLLVLGKSTDHIIVIIMVWTAAQQIHKHIDEIDKRRGS